MRAKRSMRWILVVTAAACAGMAALPGCELLVEFDRSKIPQEGGVDATTPGDAQPGMDAPAETSVQDSMVVDSAGDAPTDSGTDAPSDAGDGAADSAPADTGTPMDTGVDTGMDSAAPMDSAADSAADTGSGMDAGDAATDAADAGD